MQRLLLVVIITLFSSLNICSQAPQKPNASEIYESIKKLNFLGSVLYVAAHPDDENTRLISYMSNHLKARTAYLSLTRGDGGQNLIGPEIRELLGVIRTQELLTARQIDGGEQLFTRANDFGYSKHPDETLEIWNKEKVLSDVVLAIRQFQPDIIINRFDHRSPGRTHGHHTSSAMLSIEAFDITNDKTAYPNQLKNTDLWQPKRLFFNTSWWFYGSQEKFKKADKSNLLEIDLGVFYPSFGFSNPEIAALSRSQHKSQGFGNTGTRGSEMEYVELIKGEMPQDQTNLFEGIDTTWNRVKGGQAIGTILQQVEENYDFTNPSASIPELLKAYQLIQELEDSHWRVYKTDEIKDIIYACAGLYLEAASMSSQATPGETVKLNIETINRSPFPITLKSITCNNTHISKQLALTENIGFDFHEVLDIPSNQEPTTPYWLTKKGTLGMYQVSDESLIGKPETPRVFKVSFELIFNNTPITFSKAVIYKTNDPVKGEVYKPFEIIPEASVKISEKVIIFENGLAKDIPVIVKAGRDDLTGTLSLNYPKEWQVTPEKQEVKIPNKGEEKTVVFRVSPPKNQHEGHVVPVMTVNGKNYSKELIEIDYEHIPYQTVLLPAESKIVRLDIQKKGENIGYIVGAGDVVPESLEQIGYKVTLLKPDDITPETLQEFDAVVVGIRAYNILETIKFKQQLLFDFVSNGGNIIVQYNTSHQLKVENLAPYKLELSKDRVTDEYAEVKFLEPKHPILNTPNKITQEDFKGWTQERGLYFPNKWGKEFTPILSMHDKGESAKKGSLLVAKYGKGYYIYTGLSFFREFPEGVSGAYRLFANMLSIGKETMLLGEKR
ncbi:PIG-L family deacetylase [Xanthomarina sp. F1114]|uniref:PIG-L family deacetylase n=1 Tax=Xanthomarina sp. F1114 TaxID=2996019 RepID=UPI00225E2247|nr:PIG-L family deacetylase [Xanthomarina sp. F1114]MCX7548576.1 PIG-L family deacetylase [Xanthomarina sp. F1114]